MIPHDVQAFLVREANNKLILHTTSDTVAPLGLFLRELDIDFPVEPHTRVARASRAANCAARAVADVMRIKAPISGLSGVALREYSDYVKMPGVDYGTIPAPVPGRSTTRSVLSAIVTDTLDKPTS